MIARPALVGLLSCASLFSPPPVVADSGPADLQLLATGDWLSNRRGGLREDDRFLLNVDLSTRLRAGEQGSVLVHGSYNSGETFSADVSGDIQVVSNIEAEEALRLYQFYYEHGDADADGGLLLGLWDLNSRLDVIEPALLFMNSSHGIGPEFAFSGERGPSIFPVTSLSLYGHRRLDNGVRVHGAVLDAVPGDPDKTHRTAIELSRDEGALFAGEVNWPLGEDWVATLGGWGYTARFDDLDGEGEKHRSYGGYLSIAGDVIDDRLSAWLRHGRASDNVQSIGNSISAGLVLDGAAFGRPGQRLGLAVARAGASDAFRDLGATRAETNVELTWSVPLNDRLRLQPTVQYIRNPGLDPALDDALVFGIRVEISQLLPLPGAH